MKSAANGVAYNKECVMFEINVRDAEVAANHVVAALTSDQCREVLVGVITSTMFNVPSDGPLYDVYDFVASRVATSDFTILNKERVEHVVIAAQVLLDLFPGPGAETSNIRELATAAVTYDKYEGPLPRP